MGKLEYLDALKSAMTGLPPETQAKTLAYYEQRFIDGVAAGRTEQEVAAELDDPRKIAMTLRTSVHMSAFEKKRTPANFGRLLFSGIGLAIFNLFMVVPAMVYASLLAALYVSGVALYFSGVVVTASGLAGTNELVLDRPFSVVVNDDESIDRRELRVEIDETGVHVHEEPGARGGDEPRGVRIFTEVSPDSRGTQIAAGLGFVVGGIVLFLLSLVITRYTFVGIRRYIQMNLSLLKGS